ncbi:MAG: ATP-dependent DNA helicase, partial [Lachnospiraceae bacterium]|nr:ATP-dependent DNA helicase [Lachnospiraceae bacterium]
MNDSISISVRHLVEFILRSGDIDRRHSASSVEAMQMGSMIHRKLQEEESGEEYDYRAEVPLKYVYEADEYELVVEGRADGIITSGSQIIVDEIKTVYGDVKHLEEPREVHLAQARVYAAIVAMDRALTEIGVRMTYCSIDTMEIKYFHYSYTFKEITQLFQELINEYDRWARFIVKWKKVRDKSASELQFPYPYREGQKELAANVYRTIYHRKRLFLMAPTGVGKTLSVTFPAVKAIGEGRTDKIFYLTGKTVTGRAAVEAFEVMISKGLEIKTVVIAGREKVCLNDNMKCNPDECPYAKGHYDRVNDVLYELLTTVNTYSREVLSNAAEKAGICPYELALDLATFTDAVICDYNYVFDPGACLSDYFAPGKDGNELVLVDEAHNLVDRARDMYSAFLDSGRIAGIRKKLRAAVKEGEFPGRIPTRAATMLGKLVKLLNALGEYNGDFAENVDKDEFILTAGKALSLFENMLDNKEVKGIFDDEDIL